MTTMTVRPETIVLIETAGELESAAARLDELFPDDPEGLTAAIADLTSAGLHRCGGGAAPLITLTVYA